MYTDTAELYLDNSFWCLRSSTHVPHRVSRCSERKHGSLRGAPFAQLQSRTAGFRDRCETFVMTTQLEKPLKIALVAPSMGILGGQAVQAARLLESLAARSQMSTPGWFPLIPSRRARFGWTAGVRYLRTLATQLSYWPLLFRRSSGRADVVHVFSASYWSFLLAPLPAVLVARLLGKPVVMNYRSGEAPDHLKRSAIARAMLRHVDRNVVPSSFLRDVFARYRDRVSDHPEHRRRGPLRVSRREPLRPRVLSTRNFEEPLQPAVHACVRFALSRIDTRRRRSRWWQPGLRKRRSARSSKSLRPSVGATFAGRVPPQEMWRYYADADIYLQTPDIDNMPAVGSRSVRERLRGGLDRCRWRARHPHERRAWPAGALQRPRGSGRAMRRLLEDAPLAARLTDAARESCARIPSGRRSGGQWLALYRDLARRHGPGGAWRRMSITSARAGSPRWTARSCASESTARRGSRFNARGTRSPRLAGTDGALVSILNGARLARLAAARDAARAGDFMAAHRALAVTS